VILSKPYSDACDRNREPILAVIKSLLASSKSVLEVGSGTGQHAVYFAAKLPHLIWQTSDRQENIGDITLWLDEAALANTPPPLVLDVRRDSWPDMEVDAVFSANTAHIMSWEEVECFFTGVGRHLSASGRFMLYGPFNYNHRFSSDSNRQFDAWLRIRDCKSGIRNFEDLDELARKAAMQLEGDYPMPANNRFLCWQKAG